MTVRLGPAPVGLRVVLIALSLAAVSCSRSKPATQAGQVLDITFQTSNGFVGRNVDGSSCTFGGLAVIVKNEAGVIVGTGTLGTGSVVSGPPSYRCTAPLFVPVDSPVKFAQIDVYGETFTKPAGGPITISLG